MNSTRLSSLVRVNIGITKTAASELRPIEASEPTESSETDALFPSALASCQLPAGADMHSLIFRTDSHVSAGWACFEVVLRKRQLR